MITITLTATPARKEVLLLLPEFRNRDFSAPTAWKREGVAFVAAECLDGRIGPLAACRAPALPRFLYGGARSLGIPIRILEGGRISATGGKFWAKIRILRGIAS